MTDSPKSTEQNLPSSNESDTVQQSQNLIESSRLRLNQLWAESEIARGVTGAVIGALVAAPFGNRELFIGLVGVGAFICALDLLPWRESHQSTHRKQLYIERELNWYTQAIERNPNDDVV